ncbi:MAG: ribokinase [Halobacteriales archaeon]|nr:ribokinase [Halobacteriales archaeon]
MAAVVSLGSINVDRVQYLTAGEIAELENRYDWFPDPGATVKIDGVPEELERRPYRNFMGGKGANQAVAASRAGAETALLGKVGTDQTDYDVLGSLKRSGVQIDHIGVSDVETGKAYIYVDEDGENWIGVIEGANGEVDPDYIDRQFDRICAPDCLLLQNEIPLRTLDYLLDKLDAEPDGPSIIFDPAPVEGAETLLDHESLDIVVPNENEYAALEDALRAFDGTIINTRSAKEIVVKTTDCDSFTVTPPEVDAVDATGAGDVFDGYLAATLAEGESLRDAVEIASVAASLSTLAEGAQDAIPTREEVSGSLLRSSISGD